MTLRTRVSIEECKVRLAAGVDEERYAFSWSGYGGSKPILGKLRGTGFRLQKRRYYRNSFAPLFGAAGVNFGRWLGRGEERDIVAFLKSTFEASDAA
jgi:hypothetical protein